MLLQPAEINISYLVRLFNRVLLSHGSFHVCLAAPALGLKLFLAGSLKERLCPIVEKKARVATLIRLGRRLSSRIGDLMCESVSA